MSDMNAKEKFIWRLKETKANHDLSKVNYKTLVSGKKIKVGFIVNMPEVWDKECPVFESMVEDPDFEPLLIVTPAFDVVSSSIGEYGSEWDYFYNLYGDKYVIKAKTDDGYVDLQQFEFDYVFYQRPYENYLPGQYHTSPVSRYAKTCYIPYFLLDAKLDKSYYKTNFFRYLQIFFCSSEEQLRDAQTASNRKNVCFGYPAMEGIEIDKEDIAAKAVLYTPRWSEEKYYGGTSFYRFKDDFVEIRNSLKKLNEEECFAADYEVPQGISDAGGDNSVPKDVSDAGANNDPLQGISDADTGNISKIIFRPHPLLFPTAINTGRMTENEVAEYKQSLENNGIIIDSNKDYMKTFAETGILVTDQSSIIINYFLSGKPIIYCTTLEGFENSDIYAELFESIYMAKDWNDVVKLIAELRQGNDPLKEARLKCIEKITCGGGSVEKIKKYLKQ